MTQDEYYTTPPDKVFKEIKKAAIEIWNTYNDEFGYRTEKLERIKDIPNYSDNAWYIVAMFDQDNRRKLLALVSSETAVMILNALSEGVTNAE